MTSKKNNETGIWWFNFREIRESGAFFSSKKKNLVKFRRAISNFINAFNEIRDDDDDDNWEWLHLFKEEQTKKVLFE